MKIELMDNFTKMAKNIDIKLSNHSTPAWLAEKMVNELNITNLDTILEPSAGDGSLVEAVLKYLSEMEVSPYHFDVVDNNPDVCKVLQHKYGEAIQVVEKDFMKMDEPGVYDVIVACPPLNGDGVEHFKKMYQNLSDYGQLVCVLTSNWIENPKFDYREYKEFREFIGVYNERLEELKGMNRVSGGNIEWVHGEDHFYLEFLPLDTFKDSGYKSLTTVMIRLMKGVIFTE